MIEALQWHHVVGVIMGIGGLIFAITRIRDYLIKAPLERQAIKNDIQNLKDENLRLKKELDDHKSDDNSSFKSLLDQMKEIADSLHSLKEDFSKMKADLQHIKENWK